MQVLRQLVCFAVLLAFISCRQIDYKTKPLRKSRVKKHLSSHWILQLPPGTQIKNLDSESLSEPNIVVFPNDSLVIKYHFGHSDMDQSTECSFEKRKELAKSMAAAGLCEGDGSGVHQYTAFIDEMAGLTGLLTNTLDKGRKYISLQTSDCASGQWLQLTFESVAREQEGVINEILQSLEFRK